MSHEGLRSLVHIDHDAPHRLAAPVHGRGGHPNLDAASSWLFDGRAELR